MKLFLTVGTQLPFDRLTRALDDWCAADGAEAEVFGQVGVLQSGSYRPRHFDWSEMVDASAFKEQVVAADLVVSHAGMGSVITAFTTGTRLLVMPRRADLREHRNDHQLATVAHLEGRPGLFLARAPEDLPGQIAQALAAEAVAPSLSPFAEEPLIDALRGFIHDM